VRYAVDAGVLDGGVATDLESEALGPREPEQLADADLIISTGCYGYVTERTFEQILAQSRDTRPWLANMVLRMFDFAPAEALLADMGYVTEKVPGLVPQRRFASPDERQNVLDNLAQEGIDADRFEETGWYFAELYVSRPQDAAIEMPIGEVVPRVGRPVTVTN
jgi:carnitine O-acetyltransferase